MSFKYSRLDKDNAVVLFVDHQAGLLSLARDYSPDEFKNNVLALADIAKYFKLPVILTTSFEQGPNGPIVPELKSIFPDAPYFARPGQINAWDNEDFVKAVKATGHCSGTFSPSVREAAWLRMQHAGAQLLNWFAVGCELQRDWRNDVEGFGKVLSEHLPAYANLMQSYNTVHSRK